MLSLIIAVLTSFTFLLGNLFVDDHKDPRNYRIGQEQFEQPRGE